MGLCLKYYLLYIYELKIYEQLRNFEKIRSLKITKSISQADNIESNSLKQLNILLRNKHQWFRTCRWRRQFEEGDETRERIDGSVPHGEHVQNEHGASQAVPWEVQLGWSATQSQSRQTHAVS